MAGTGAPLLSQICHNYRIKPLPILAAPNTTRKTPRCNSEPGRRWTTARRLYVSDYWLISSPCQTFASISGGSPRSTMKRPRTQGARAIRLTRLVAGTHSGLGPPRNGGGLFYAGARSRRADRHIWCGAPPIDTRPRGPRPLASCSAPSVVWLYLLFGPPAASRGNRGTPPQHKVGGTTCNAVPGSGRSITGTWLRISARWPS